MSATLETIYTINPITTNQPSDLMYFSRTPYTIGNDCGMSYANFSLQFSAPGALFTINGNSGSATPSSGTITITTGNSNTQGTALFTGAGSTLTYTFTDTNGNTGVGKSCMSTISGTNCTAIGDQALLNSEGSYHVAIGYQALSGTVGTDPGAIAIGSQALQNYSSSTGGGGSASIAVGYQSMQLSSAQRCVSIGSFALKNMTSTTGRMTALGFNAGTNIVGGNYCTLLGSSAGNSYTGSESSNICLGANTAGVLGESNTLHIGLGTGTGNGDLKAAFICGIGGVNIGSVVTVVTESSDQLGTASIVGGTGITITPSANVITISNTGAGVLSWNTIASATIASINQGYISNNAATRVVLTMPSTAAVGSEIKLMGLGAAGWQIAQPAGVNIQVGEQSTTSGTGGSLSSTNQYDSIYLICIVANTTWSVLGAPQSLGLTWV